jgi:ParB family chromosome partitioning protein
VIDPVALEDLKASIAQIGILTPLLFRVGEESWLIIISGERRCQAAMALGMTIVPGICVEGNFVEEAEALQRLMVQESYTQEQLRGMLTACAAYRASLEKGKASRQAKDANDPESFFALLEKTGVKIGTIDTASWDEETLSNLHEAVATLRERLDASFPAVNPGPSTELS